MSLPASARISTAPSLITALGLLWLGGIAARVTILAVPPVIPLIHDDLHMTETQVGLSWRLEFLVWAAPALATALLYLAFTRRLPSRAPAANEAPRHWWPDWTNPLIWLLGLTFGCNNASYYGLNAFAPDYLNSIGRADLIGATLGW